MSAYNAPTETLPRFNSAVFIQDANVSYPVAQGALTIPKNITIVDGSNTIIITPTSITINGIVYNLSNIAYLNLSQTFTGVNTFSNTLKANTLQGLLTTDNISLYDTTTAEISIGSGNAGNINIGSSSSNISLKGVNTAINGNTLTNILKSLNSTSSVSLYEVPMTSLKMGHSASPNTITGLTNTINGNTTFTNTILGNTITGKLTTDNISLYDSTTAEISIGSGNAGNINIGSSSSSNISLKSANTTINGYTLTNTLKSLNSTSSVSLYEVPMVSLSMGNASSPNTITGYTNTINGDTTITNTLKANSLVGKAVGDTISLYGTSTGLITFGNSTLGTNTNTIYGITTFNQALNAQTPASLINNTQVPTTAYLTTYYAPLTGTIANATAITLTPNTTDTADYIPFSSTPSGSSNLKTSTVLLYNASSGNLSSTIHTTNTLQGQAVSSAISLYTTSTSGGITLGNSSNTNIISGNTTFSNYVFLTSMRAVTPTAGVFFFDNMTSGSITIGGASQTGAINIGTTGANIIAINGGSFIVYPIMSVNTIKGRVTTDNISLYETTTGTITFGNSTLGTNTNNIYGITTFNQALNAPTPASLLNTTRVPTTAYLTTYYPSLSSNNTLSGTNTFTNTVLCNTVTGRAVGDAISLYNTSTGTITLGNTSSMNTINGATTFNQNVTFNSQINGIGTTDFSNIPKIATMYQAFGGNSPFGFPTYDVTYNTTLFPNSFRVYGAFTTDYTYYANAKISNQLNLVVNDVNFNKINFLQICINANSSGSVGGINSIAGIDFTTWAGRVNAGCRIYAQDNSNFSADLLFVTAPSGSASSTPTERIRVMADGNIGINQSNPQYLLDVNGTGRFVSTLYGNTLQGTTVSSAINLYTNSTSGGITLGNSSNTNTINGNTTVTNTLLANTLTGKAVTNAISLYTTSTSGGITLGNSSNTNTINGNTTVTNTLLANTLTGKAVTDAISLYTTSTSGGITLGNSSNTITINGVTTLNNYITTSIFNPIVSTNSLFNMILSNKTGSISGQNNTGLGVGSLSALTTGRDNTAIGTYALNTITDQNYNTAVGSGALGTIVTTGIDGGGNTAVGSNAGNALKYGKYNCFFGQLAGTNMGISQADYNTFLGTSTSFIAPNTGFSYSTAIGFGAVISASNQIMLGRVNEIVVAPNNITITNTLNGNTLAGKTTTDAISLYTTSTSGGITLGNSSNTNTINGNTTITNTLLGNTITGKLTTDAISLYTTSTSGGITLGNSSNTNTIRGNTTMPDTLFTDNVKGLFAGDNISLFTTTTTGTMNFVTGLTTGICYIGNLLSTTGQMIIYGAVGGTSTLFSNVVAGAISIGSSLQTGNMTIYGSIGGISNLFTNSVTGTTSILTSNTDGDLNIGNSSNIANLNFKWGYMFFTASALNFKGYFTVQQDATYLSYSPFLETLFTSTGNQSNTQISKYINCNYSSAGQIMFLRFPDSKMDGMEVVIRFTNVTGSVSVLGSPSPSVFKNLSNATVTSLSGSNVIRVICLPIGSTYYWFQL
jgi:hypothetical protein